MDREDLDSTLPGLKWRIVLAREGLGWKLFEARKTSINSAEHLSVRHDFQRQHHSDSNRNNRSHLTCIVLS